MRFASLICLVRGVPEATIVSRMIRRWRRMSLLVSVVARMLGWTLLF
ncbi:MAG: hypothetical protein ACK5IB_10970 [Qingshengfaniella sp.]